MEVINKFGPLAIVVALGIKAAAFGINISDACLGVSLVGLLALREHLAKHQEVRVIAESTSKKLEEMKNAINAQNKVIEAQALEYDKLRNSMTGIKLQFGQKDASGNRKLG
jgi:Co/Zn/Cd efflux system component